MSEDLKNAAAEGEGKPRYANGLFPHECVHPYTGKDGEERAVVNLPAGTVVGGRDMTGFSTDVRMMPWMKKQLEAGDDVRVGFNVKWEPSLFKGRGEDAEYARVKPWDLVKGVKAAREAGSRRPSAYVKIAVPAESVHRYQREAQDGKVFEKAIVDLPNGMKTDVFLQPWMISQHDEGKDVVLGFKADEPVELFKGSGADRVTAEMDPVQLRVEVAGTDRPVPAEAKKPSFKERAGKAQKASEEKEAGSVKKEPAKQKESEIGD